MKYLLLLLVVAVGLYLLLGRKRKRDDTPGDQPDGTRGAAMPPQADAAPSPMLACAHCGVHLPREEAVVDAVGRGFCSEAHRLAGPR